MGIFSVFEKIVCTTGDLEESALLRKSGQHVDFFSTNELNKRVNLDIRAVNYTTLIPQISRYFRITIIKLKRENK